MKIAEKIFIVLAIIGMSMKLFPIYGGGILLTISVFGLWRLYFFLGFSFFNGLGFRETFKKRSYENVKAFIS
jgi:hypothetical protein